MLTNLVYWHRYAFRNALWAVYSIQRNQYHFLRTVQAIAPHAQEEQRLREFGALVRECEAGLNEFKPNGYRPSFTIWEN